MICIHSWSRPFSEGHRKGLRWVTTGPAYQVCIRCTQRRESPIQFTETALAKTLREIEQDMAEFKWEKV